MKVRISEEMKHELSCVHESKPSAKSTQVSALASIQGDLLCISFEVESLEKPSVDPTKRSDLPEWGLWDFDVVEVFVSLGAGPYYEFQVSPLGQYFELKILKPRVEVDREFRSGVKWAARQKGSCWSADLLIPLVPLGWDGDPASVQGGFFAILGETSARTYWAAFLPEQVKPDFHLPKYFRPLV